MVAKHINNGYNNEDREVGVKRSEKIRVLNANKIGNRKVMFPLPKAILKKYASGLSLVDAEVYKK